MVPACSSGTLTNVMPHRNAMLQTQDMTPHPVIVYRHRVDLSLCYPFLCLWSDPTRKSFPNLPHTPANIKLHDGVVVLVSQKLGRSAPYPPSLEPSTCGVKIHYTICSPQLLFEASYTVNIITEILND